MVRRWEMRNTRNNNRRAVAAGFDEDAGVPRMTQADWAAVTERMQREWAAQEAARPKGVRERLTQAVVEELKKRAWNAIQIPIVSQVPLVGSQLNEYLKQRAVKALRDAYNDYVRSVERQFNAERERRIAALDELSRRRNEEGFRGSAAEARLRQM